MMAPRPNPCRLPDKQSTNPAAYCRIFCDKAIEYAVTSMPAADKVYVAALHDRSMGFAGSPQVTSNAEFLRWFTLLTNERAQARRIRAPAGQAHILDAGAPAFAYPPAGLADNEAPPDFNQFKFMYEARSAEYKEVTKLYEQLREQFIAWSAPADQAFFLNAPSTMSVADMITHTLTTYAAAQATDTTLLDDVLGPADMAVPVGTQLAAFESDLALVNTHVRRPYDANNAKVTAFLNKYPADIVASMLLGLSNNAKYAALANRDFDAVDDDGNFAFRTEFVELLEARRADWVATKGTVKAATTTKSFKTAKGGCWAHGDCSHTTSECTWIASHAGFMALKDVKPPEATVTHKGKKITVKWHFLANRKDPTTANGMHPSWKPRKDAAKKANAADQSGEEDDST